MAEPICLETIQSLASSNAGFYTTHFHDVSHLKSKIEVHAGAGISQVGGAPTTEVDDEDIVYPEGTDSMTYVRYRSTSLPLIGGKIQTDEAMETMLRKLDVFQIGMPIQLG